jgi:beta-lactamase class A
VATQTAIDSLVDSLNDRSEKEPFHVGWYFKDLASGSAADRNGAVVVPSASTRKIAIMMAALKAVNEGKLSLDQPVPIQAKYQNNNSGCFQHLQPGFVLPLRDHLTMMIIVSDNTCTGTVADLVGLDTVNALCQSIGMTGTAHRHGIPPGNLDRNHPVDASNATTPNDVGLLLELILRGTNDEEAAAGLGCTAELCRLGLDILLWQKLNTRLPSMLPGQARVAHKTGTGARNYNDAGIIFQGDTPLCVLTAYTENVPSELEDGRPGHTATAQLIGTLARLSYDALKA